MSAKDLFYSADKEFSNNEKKIYFREDFIYNVTEDLLVTLENDDISKADLAKKMGKSKAFITQLLSGSRNMTLGTLADICFTINIKPQVILKKTTEHNAERDNQKKLHWQSLSIKKNLYSESENRICKIIDFKSTKIWQKAS